MRLVYLECLLNRCIFSLFRIADFVCSFKVLTIQHTFKCNFGFNIIVYFYFSIRFNSSKVLNFVFNHFEEQIDSLNNLDFN